ncbi:hypothetical protein NOVOSPHI9U_600004 [Novosphingobium sp. 9U]|nr:hypothetical protein NOVOSPHI9U_600004 [Novosphingobium sp. 9U]
MCPCSAKVRPRKCAPQHASIAMTQADKVVANATIASRVIRLRITTVPAASMAAKLQLFLPRSIYSRKRLAPALILWREFKPYCVGHPSLAKNRDLD